MTQVRMYSLWVAGVLLMLLGHQVAQSQTPTSTSTWGEIFYLALDSTGVTNIHHMALSWEDGIALTQEAIDIYYYDVAPNANYLVYAGRAERGGTSEIMRLDIHGGLRQLTDCRTHDIDCRRPQIAPDSVRIAFERMAMNGGDVPAPPADPEIWLWADGKSDYVAQGLRPTWQSDGTLIYESLTDMATPVSLSHYENNQNQTGAYLQHERGVIQAFVWYNDVTQAQRLSLDDGYTYTALHPSPDGLWLLLERVQLATHTAEIILYHWQTRDTRLLAVGHSAQWK